MSLMGGLILILLPYAVTAPSLSRASRKKKRHAFPLHTMSYAANGTTPILDAWSGYVAYAQTQLTPWSSRMTILSIATIPVLVVVLNVLSQLVRRFLSLNTYAAC